MVATLQSVIRLANTRPDDPLAQELTFTATYRRLRDADPVERELSCLRVQFPAILQPITAGDLFAGRIRYPLVGFSPEPGGLGYYCSDSAIRAMLEPLSIPPARQDPVREMLDFWRTETTTYRTRAACPDWVNRVLPEDDWQAQSGMAFPVYRMGGTQLNYATLLRLGVPGLREEIQQRQAKAPALFRGMLGALDLLSGCCRHYAAQARTLADGCPDCVRAAELTAIASTLEPLSERAPATFREAIQLMWLYALLSGTWNYGRMDVYLGPFLARDLDSSALTEAEALGLIRSLWRLIRAYDNQYNNRVFIGGKGRPNEVAADRFARLAMKATLAERLTQPQLSLRFYRGQDPSLMQQALTLLGEGCTFPILYNDDVNIPAVAAAFNVTEAEATEYLPFGCGEHILNHRSVGTPSGVINLLTCLEVALHNGRDPVSGRQAGPATGELRKFEKFEQVWDAYRAQVERCVTALAVQEKVEYEVAGVTAPFLFLSMLYDDCLDRGRSIFAGGARYLGGTLEAYGNTNTADSLTAIDELVFRQKKLGLTELVAALDADFNGCESLRRQLLAAPKYGNDHPVADVMAQRVHEHVCRVTREQAANVGLDSYLIVIINNSANVILGKNTAASPDGRRATEAMANGNNPAPGLDRHGVTAFLNSLVKLDPNVHAGAVQNMKFSRSMFTVHREKAEALLATYFAQGGTQAMITVVSRDDLEAAMREPEKWGHLMVRVGGFSARFVELPRDVQLEVLQRTLYE
ncbi:MAG TPA: pyruvate formate lyase family protein [Verrucomicrobiae bacterium]|nr:pyruvate formate lyase family protein [Verrucomicrobiae bacterium]